MAPGMPPSSVFCFLCAPSSLSFYIFFFWVLVFYFVFLYFFQRLGLRGFEHGMGFDGRREKDGKVLDFKV